MTTEDQAWVKAHAFVAVLLGVALTAAVLINTMSGAI